MGDLAQAIVDLGRSSEQRRNTRRQFREATAVVIEELLRHLRVGDEAAFRADEDDPASESHAYRVERVTWPLVDNRWRDPDGFLAGGSGGDLEEWNHPRGGQTLVRYDQRFAEGDYLDGAVLFDPRVSYVDGDGIEHPAAGRSIVRITPADETHSPDVDLHLATDTDLMRFAADAIEIVRKLNREFSEDAARFAEATDAIARLAPR
jgi:hypothetical protein